MKTFLLLLVAVVVAAPALALDFDQNVTPDVIFGSGNANGAFTVDVQDETFTTIELGLRAKLRFDVNNQPQNIFNSNGDGNYLFLAGVAPGGFSWSPNLPTTPVWNFEFTVNVDRTSLGNATLDDFTYELGLDFDPSPTGTNFLAFDPITPTASAPVADHAIGDNTGTVVVAGDGPTYAGYLATYVVAQNSWNYEFFNNAPFDGFDPTVDGVYDVYLKAFHQGVEVAFTQISIIVGDAVPNDEASWSEIKTLYR